MIAHLVQDSCFYIQRKIQRNIFIFIGNFIIFSETFSYSEEVPIFSEFLCI